ncbi:CASP-like protein 4A1 [Octodon degus]|uniref:CASP-like protein 4A1 n=1 Tax=Octodon degus TaxID=10160 RepID=A0A6P6ESP1_OCTDE|nr:CASP-like protein 4A1 [Octodon degus]
MGVRSGTREAGKDFSCRELFSLLFYVLNTTPKQNCGGSKGSHFLPRLLSSADLRACTPRSGASRRRVISAPPPGSGSRSDPSSRRGVLRAPAPRAPLPAPARTLQPPAPSAGALGLALTPPPASFLEVPRCRLPQAAGGVGALLAEAALPPGCSSARRLGSVSLAASAMRVPGARCGALLACLALLLCQW